MSIGFGVGDFIAARQLTTKIRKQLVDAPSEFKELIISENPSMKGKAFVINAHFSSLIESETFQMRFGILWTSYPIET